MPQLRGTPGERAFGLVAQRRPHGRARDVHNGLVAGEHGVADRVDAGPQLVDEPPRFAGQPGTGVRPLGRGQVVRGILGADGVGEDGQLRVRRVENRAQRVRLVFAEGPSPVVEDRCRGAGPHTGAQHAGLPLPRPVGQPQPHGTFGGVLTTARERVGECLPGGLAGVADAEQEPQHDRHADGERGRADDLPGARGAGQLEAVAEHRRHPQAEPDRDEPRPERRSRAATNTTTVSSAIAATSDTAPSNRGPATPTTRGA